MRAWIFPRNVLVASLVGLAGCASTSSAPSGQKTASAAELAASSHSFISLANRNFHADYDRLRAEEEATLGTTRPLVTISGFKVTLRFHGKASEWSLFSERYPHGRPSSA